MWDASPWMLQRGYLAERHLLACSDNIAAYDDDVAHTSYDDVPRADFQMHMEEVVIGRMEDDACSMSQKCWRRAGGDRSATAARRNRSSSAAACPGPAPGRNCVKFPVSSRHAARRPSQEAAQLPAAPVQNRTAITAQRSRPNECTLHPGPHGLMFLSSSATAVRRNRSSAAAACPGPAPGRTTWPRCRTRSWGRRSWSRSASTWKRR